MANVTHDRGATVSRRRTRLIWTTIAGTAAIAAAALFVMEAPIGSVPLHLSTLIVGVGVVAAAMITGRHAPAAAHAVQAGAFAQLYETTPEPMLLTDRAGRLIAANRAVRVRTPRIAHVGYAGEALTHFDQGAEAATYRLLNRTPGDEESAEFLGEAHDLTLHAQPLDPGYVIWRLSAADGPQTGAAAGDSGADAGDTAPPIAQVLEDMPVALMRLSGDGEIQSLNAAARALLGAAARPGVAIANLLDGLARPMSARIAEAAAGQSVNGPELARGASDDCDAFVQVSLSRLGGAEPPSLLAVMSDATEMKTLEQQFVQSQKMQAVGQLAGGVAHDFNNLLTAILGHCDLLMMRTDQGAPDFADLSQIRQNAKRAAGLVRQLLAFSRKQTLRPEPVRIDDSLGDLMHLLNRLLGERVTMKLEYDADLWPVWIDAQQFEQVVMNLVVNARDAMPDGGEVTLSCHNLSARVDFRRDRAVVPAGDYVCIEVSDSGYGIHPDKLDQIFEPFFTTKAQGEGTGLGLSTAYGIVKQTGGFIFADSAPGEGATFSIYLPRMEDAASAPAPLKEPSHGDLTGSGRILLVEDEAPVRAFACRALRMRGYDVIEASNAEMALQLLETDAEGVDLLVSDVVMPGMDGPSWVRKARKIRPDIAVIFMSGYAEDVFANGMGDVGNHHFLPKPFTLEDLAEAVKEALAGDAPAPPAARP